MLIPANITYDRSYICIQYTLYIMIPFLEVDLSHVIQYRLLYKYNKHTQN